ncbi:MAG TPA: hypothetical protein VKB69_09780 [Micromonosporaceae bacterium]|nr:hypothetical protein [Micromonosporaceae bacterium]
MTSLSLDVDPKRKRVVTWIVLGAIFLILLIIALAVFRSAKNNVQASNKADQLITALQKAGLPQPSKDQIVRVMGTDGGAICHDPDAGLTQAQLQAQLDNGAAGPGMRPTLSDQQVVQGELLALGVYCPEQLAEFTNQIKNNYKFADVINN